MEQIPISLNNIQLASFLFKDVKHSIILAGRGLGKSSDQALKFHRNITSFPRGNTIVTGKSYAQLLTRTLPPLFSFLHKLGYRKDVDYFIGKFPPAKLKWQLPYEHPFKADRYISFGTKLGAHGIILSSQDRDGDARGGNYDFEMTDESLLINKEKYDMEVGPTVRANKVKFKNIPFHWGSHHSSTMPYTSQGRWLLEFGNYYKTDYGIDIFNIWNEIVNLQLQILDIEDDEEIKLQWNEILRLKREITPRPSKDGTQLFLIGNSFDNLQNLPDNYVKEAYRKMQRQVFLIEILNMILKINGDPYFTAFSEKKHLVAARYDYSFIDDLTERTNYDFEVLKNVDCRYDADCDKKEPLFISFDLGGRITTMLVSQIDKKDGNSFKKLRIINEFSAMPENNTVLVNDVCKQFTDYYKYMYNKDIYFVRDSHGDNKGPNYNVNANEQIKNNLRLNNFHIIDLIHRNREPQAYDKWLLVNNILANNNNEYFDVEINQERCKYLIISIQNAKVKQKGERFEMDKSSETKATDQREATHFADNFCKLLHTMQKNYNSGYKLFIATKL